MQKVAHVPRLFVCAFTKNGKNSSINLVSDPFVERRFDMIALTIPQFVCLVILVFAIFFFFLFVDLKRKCRLCGSRFAETIFRFETYRIDTKIMVWKMKFRRCLKCGDKALLRKSTIMRQTGKTLSIRL